MVKSTNCSSRGPQFNSQQPHGGSQPQQWESDVLFVSENSDSILINKINKIFKNKEKKKELILLRNFNFKNTTKEAGEMAKQARALVALAENHIQFPAPTCL